jgi:hypothetical protein
MGLFDAEEYRPLIPNGDYIAQCFKYETAPYLGKQMKIYLWFRIVEGEHADKEIYMACNLPDENKKLSPEHKYYKVWQFVNGSPPSRGTKLSPRLFKNKIFKIKTQTVKRPFGDGVMSESHNYSKVGEIIEVHAG